MHRGFPVISKTAGNIPVLYVCVGRSVQVCIVMEGRGMCTTPHTQTGRPTHTYHTGTPPRAFSHDQEPPMDPNGAAVALLGLGLQGQTTHIASLLMSSLGHCPAQNGRIMGVVCGGVWECVVCNLCFEPV